MNEVSTELASRVLLAAVFVVAALIESFRERSAPARFSRGMAVCVAGIGLSVALAQSLGIRVEEGGVAMGPMVVAHQAAYVSKLTFEGKYLCSIVSTVLFLGAVLFVPSAPLVKFRMSRVFLMQALVIVLIEVQRASSFLSFGALLLLILNGAVRHHARSLPDDERGEVRAQAFLWYHGLALVAIGVSLTLRVLQDTGLLVPGQVGDEIGLLQTLDLSMLCLASAIVAGIFPFHGWVVPFLSAPRGTIFLPLLCIQAGLLFFFRLYAPIVTQFWSHSFTLMILPVIGLLYAALLFFGETRLKRIPGYLYLSHVSLMALSASGFEELGMMSSMLDGVNVLVAVLGLLGVCALLTSRFGVRGVLAPTGLGALFPELAVCYLVCVLSLVGFPGTLGFIEEEVTIGQGLEHHAFLVGVVAVALTLNGFSGFRLFARIFYGQAVEERDPETALSFRERAVIFFILALIVLNGVAPKFLVSALTDFAS